MAEFLRSVQNMERSLEIHVLVVENSCEERQLVRLRRTVAQFSNVELLQSSRNRGYFGAARFGLESYLAEAHELPDWVIVCNHDVVIEDRDFFTKLLGHDPNTVGVIAPRIQTRETCLDQNPFMKRRPGRFRWWTYRFAKSAYGVAVVWDWMGRVKKVVKSFGTAHDRASGGASAEKSKRIYAAHGSFFIFSRSYFERGGYLDENLFLYGEEISVAEICRSLNLPILYEPSLRVLHNEHRSTGRVISRTSYERERNALRYVTSRYLSGTHGRPSRVTCSDIK
jgi:GT2 family glycosyltransferase